jgi:CHAD domain-containing protein
MSPDHSSLTSYVDRRLDTAGARAGDWLQGASEVALHDLRVELKMLRAAVRLLFPLDTARTLRRAWTPVRTLYQVSGPLRDAHVHRWVQSELAPETVLAMAEWQNVLMWRETRARRSLLRTLKTGGSVWRPSLLAAVNDVVAPHSEAELVWKVRQGLSVALSRIADLRQERDWDQVDLHKVRRLSKDARYTLGVLENLHGEGLPSGASLNLALRDVHRALGDWHDTVIILEALRRFQDTDSLEPPRQPEAYQSYLQHLLRRREKCLAAFHGAWELLLRVLEPASTPVSS